MANLKITYGGQNPQRKNEQLNIKCRDLKLSIRQNSKFVWRVDTNRTYPIIKTENGKNKEMESMSLNENRYNAFKKLASLDHIAKDLSECDIKQAEQLEGRYGIKKAIVDGGRGIALLIFDDDTQMFFDIETQAEKKVNIINSNNEYQKYYSIKLSDDGNFLEVTVKESGTLTKDPSLDTIQADFGVAKKETITENNKDLICSKFNDKDYKFRPLQTIKIPIEEVNVKPGDSPRGFWGRLFHN